MHAPDALLLTLRLGLAGMFGVAGVAKLADSAGSRQALREFGVPNRLHAPLTTLIPLAELGVAFALLTASIAVAGAAAGLVLLLLFIGAIGYSLASGRRPNCHCFGQLHSGRVSWQLLVRNGVLAVVSAIILIGGRDSPGPSLVAWLGALTAFELALVLGGTVGLALLGAQVALLVRIDRQTGRLLRQPGPTAVGPHTRPEAATTDAAAAAQGTASTTLSAKPPASFAGVAALPLGTRAPEFVLQGADGRTVTLQALRAEGKPVLLLFSDDGCQPCRTLMPRIAEWQRTHAAALTIAVLSNQNRATPSFAEHGVTSVLLENDHEVAKAYGVPGTPSAVLINADGTIATPAIAGDVEIERLVADASRRAAAAPTAALGPIATPSAAVLYDAVDAADFTLPNLDGGRVSLAQFRGTPIVLLFWNPGCSFCRKILPRIQEWDVRPVSARHQLLVVSSGSVDDNRAMALSSTVVLDPEFSVGKRYGLAGTPAVAVLDENGQLAGTPMTGGPAVLAALEFASSATPTAALLPRKRRGVEDELLDDGTMILYSSSRARVLTLNATAALVWECCDGEHRVSDIVREVREVFPAATDAERDVRDLLTMLLQEGMVSLSDETGSVVEQQATA